MPLARIPAKKFAVMGETLALSAATMATIKMETAATRTAKKRLDGNALAALQLARIPAKKFAVTG